MRPPNQITAANAGERTQFRIRGACHRPGVAEFWRSAGAGVESVVAVDFRNWMTDGVLKQ